MIKAMNNKIVASYAAFTVGFLMNTSDANAAGGGNDFGDIARNITESIEELPGLLAGIAYMVGILMGVLGVMKIKDHVENPTQTPMKDGAIRLAAGGALFALPIVFEAMNETIGTTTRTTGAASLEAVEFRVN